MKVQLLAAVLCLLAACRDRVQEAAPGVRKGAHVTLFEEKTRKSLYDGEPYTYTLERMGTVLEVAGTRAKIHFFWGRIDGLGFDLEKGARIEWIDFSKVDRYQLSSDN